MAFNGIGIDIEEISRFREKPFEQNRHFYERVFTEKEIGYCLKDKDPYKRFAERFCAKEAAIKALGKRIDFKKIEVLEDFLDLEIKVGKLNGKLSLSNTKNNAIAVVVINGQG